MQRDELEPLVSEPDVVEEAASEIEVPGTEVPEPDVVEEAASQTEVPRPPEVPEPGVMGADVLKTDVLWAEATEQDLPELDVVAPDVVEPEVTAPHFAKRDTRGLRRVLMVAAIAVWAFVIAIVTLADDSRRGCVAEAQRDPSYQAKLLGAIGVEKTDYDLALTRNGAPVTGAKVCASVSMRGMAGMAVSDTADEVEPGIYKVSIVLEMSGSWKGNILITEQGKPPASVPLTFNVS